MTQAFPDATDDTRALLDRALARDAEACRALFTRLTPVIQTRVARVLWRRRGVSGGRDIRQETEDLVQQVWCRLFERDARKLRAWDGSRGLSLERFVGLIAENEAVSVFRSRQRPWAEDPTVAEALEPSLVEHRNPESRTHARRRIADVYDHVRAHMNERGQALFELLFIEQLSSKEAGAIMDISPGAIDQWRLRLRRLIAKLAP